MLRILPALLLALVACGGQIDPSSTGNDQGAFANGDDDETPSRPSDDDDPAVVTPPAKPSQPADDLTGFVECSGQATFFVSDDGAIVSQTGVSITGPGSAIGTVRHRAGKYYFEVTLSGDSAQGVRLGVDGKLNGATSRCSASSDQTLTCSFAEADGHSGGGSATPIDSAFVAGDVIGIAVDADEQMLHYTRNGQPLGDWSFEFLSTSPALLMAPFVEAGGTRLTGAFQTFQYPLPAGYGPWDCTP